MIWENKEVFRIIYNGEPVTEKEGELTSEDVMKAARKVGLKKFTVNTLTGTELTPEDFPISEHIVLVPYNEAA